MDDVADPALLEEDGLVLEPPTLADAADPEGEPFAAEPPPKVASSRAVRPAPLALALLVLLALGAFALVVRSSDTYAFGVPDADEDGVYDVAVLTWNDESSSPIARASLVADENEVRWEIKPSADIQFLLDVRGR